MDQLLNMGFTHELAAQALAATGGKSTLKATEWILNQRSEAQKAAPAPALSSATPRGQQQSRVDRFFHGGSQKPSTREEIVTTLPSDHSKMTHGDNVDGEHIIEMGMKSIREDQSKGGAQIGYSEGKKGAPPNSCSDCIGSANAVKSIPSMRPTREPPDAEPFLKRQKQEPRDTSSQTKPNILFRFPPPCSQKPVGVSASTSRASCIPLSERMRPGTVDEVIGQDHLLGKHCILRSLLECDRIPSIVFWGPPGTGKTSLARAIANSVSYKFVSVSAVASGLKEVREILEEAKRMKKMGQRTLLFVDEVHRFNKAQQDAFLPVIEDGSIVFIGATTENPSFEVNSALLSRCRVLTVNKLQPEHIRKLLERAILDSDKGLIVSITGFSIAMSVKVEEEAIEFLACASDGDARVALNGLEIAASAAATREKDLGMSASVVNKNDREASKEDSCSGGDHTVPFKKFEGGREAIAYTPCKTRESILEAIKKIDASYSQTVAACDGGGLGFSNVHKPLKESTWITGGTIQDGIVVTVILSDVKEALQCKHLVYDKTGEEHYNIISALHKSMRGSDPDAALYWLARMLEGGEDPLYIARRLVRFASEDVGLADPSSLPQAVACYQACHFLGMPECNVNLAQCVAYLALAPKSVAVYQAIEAAQRLVRDKGQNEPVPFHLRNAPTKLMKDIGYGKGYIYPPSHSSPTRQEYLPPSLVGCKFLSWSDENTSR